MLKQAMDKLRLSAGAYSRILKVARTIADLAGAENVEPPHRPRQSSNASWTGGWGRKAGTIASCLFTCSVSRVIRVCDYSRSGRDLPKMSPTSFSGWNVCPLNINPSPFNVMLNRSLLGGCRPS